MTAEFATLIERLDKIIEILLDKGDPVYTVTDAVGVDMDLRRTEELIRKMREARND